MKKYYLLHVKDESSAEYPDDYDWNHENSSSSFRDYIWENKEFPSFIPFLEQEIYDDPEFNKINDFVFGPIDKFCISKKVKTAIEDFNLPKHKFLPVNLFKRKSAFLGLQKYREKIKDKYFALYYDCKFLSNTDYFIDFSKTKIIKNKYGTKTTEVVYINENFDYQLDLFEINLSWMTYVSERLMNKLLSINATGVEFSEIGERQYLAPRPNPKLIWI